MTRVITLDMMRFLVLASAENESVYDSRGVRELPDHMTPAIDSKRRCASDPLGWVIDGLKITMAQKESVVLGRCAHVRVDSDHLTGTVHTPGRGENASRNIECHKRAIAADDLAVVGDRDCDRVQVPGKLHACELSVAEYEAVNVASR